MKKKYLWLAHRGAAVFCRRAIAKLSRNGGRIGYIGGHGVGNLGDDLMYRQFGDLVAPAYVDTLETPRLEEMLAYVGLSGPRFFRKFVLGGGTLVNDMWLGKVNRLSQMGVPMITFGTGVGSCGKEQSEGASCADWANVLRTFKQVNVRGPISAMRLAEIGVESFITGDIGLAMPISPVPSDRTDRVAINLIDIPEYDQVLRELIATFLAVVKAYGLKVDAWVVNDDDYGFSMDVLGGAVDRTHRLKTVVDLERALSGVRFTVCARLHAAVYSAAGGVPPVMLAYRDKCRDFMESIGLADNCISLESGAILSAAAEIVKGYCDGSAVGAARSVMQSRVDELRCRLVAVAHSLVQEV